MTRRERLMATLRGEDVDRPAVSFYEIGGKKVHPDDPDPFNIYNDPSWRPLLHLAEEETDLILMRSPSLNPKPDDPRDEFFKTEVRYRNGSRFTRTEINVSMDGIDVTHVRIILGGLSFINENTPLVRGDKFHFEDSSDDAGNGSLVMDGLFLTGTDLQGTYTYDEFGLENPPFNGTFVLQRN